MPIGDLSLTYLGAGPCTHKSLMSVMPPTATEEPTSLDVGQGPILLQKSFGDIAES
jgi:hypothetical protein